MEKDIKNKVVVVTGGATGIGYEIVEHFLKEDAKTVIILDFDKIKGEESAKKLASKYGNGNVFFMECDVTKDLNEISEKILSEYKYVDLLVNNAGKVDETSARKTLEINSISLIEWTMKFWEDMRKDKEGRGGTIINIGSVYSYVTDPFYPIYKASKFAVMGFSTSLGHMTNYKKFGVRVLILCPGVTRSSLTEQEVCWTENREDLDKVKDLFVSQSADDVGRAAIKIYKEAESGTAWKIVGGKLKEILLVPEEEAMR